MVSIAGIDLSGPSNVAGTCAVVLRCHESSAVFMQQLPVAGDAEIYDLITELARNTPVVVGLDAPLSYQPGGGLRQRDRSLRERIVKRGMRHGSVMPSLLEWLSTQGIESLPCTEPSDHFVAASGAALAAWEWSRGQAVWLAPAEPPFHPFAFAC